MANVRTAVLDRIVDGRTAVLLIENGEHVTDQFDLDIDEVPNDGRHEGAVFEVVLDGEAICDLEYRADEEHDRRKAAQERFDRLSERFSDR